MSQGPSPRVLDLFAVPEAVEALAGGQGRSVQAGDLVLSPGRDPDVCAWLAPLLARLAVGLDERPRRTLRIAMPVPARDGSWVVEGWAASRWEPGTTACHEPDVVLATGRLLHAELAVACPTRPDGIDRRTDRWAQAERAAFAEVVDDTGADGQTEQLVHADLAGNVLLDASGVPVVVDVSPAWRTPRWAEAVCLVDLVASGDAGPDRLDDWATGPRLTAVRRALVFRELSDPEPHPAYAEVRRRLSLPR